MSDAKVATRSVGEEQNAEWYDRSFLEHDHWRKHYTESRYFAMWNMVVDRLVCAHVRSVLDIGCGPGQMAQLALDRGIRDYCGLDFSTARVASARSACPDARFVVGDAYSADLVTQHEYEAVICTEFLEHVNGDLQIIARLRPGVRFVGSVPNFPYKSHVRHFVSVDEVRDRYDAVLDHLRVDKLLSNPHGRAFFILDGITRLAKC